MNRIFTKASYATIAIPTLIAGIAGPLIGEAVVVPAQASTTAAPAKAAYTASVATYTQRVKAETAATVAYRKAVKKKKKASIKKAKKNLDTAHRATLAAKTQTVTKRAAWTAAKMSVTATVLGKVSTLNPYGNMQVEVAVVNGTITAVQTPMYPTHDSSGLINEDALPTLAAETLTRQAANVATVSGATYSSNAFRDSLQSALTTLGL